MNISTRGISMTKMKDHDTLHLHNDNHNDHDNEDEKVINIQISGLNSSSIEVAVHLGTSSPPCKKQKRVITSFMEEYKLLRVVGTGTFAAQVALAQRRDDASLVVIKSLDKKNLISRQQVQHTCTEKNVLTRLSHPFIVQLYNTFQTKNQVHFVLEFCSGGELFYHLEQGGPLSMEHMRFYAAEVLSALSHIHKEKIVYRDLKPENVLLDKTGHVRLVDFGFAKETCTRTYSFCGSPEYLSPEMTYRHGHAASTDMWSFGCFCYELVAGTPPFPYLPQHTLHDLFSSIRAGRVFYPSTWPPLMTSFLKKLLDVDPLRRLSANEAMDDAFFTGLDFKLVALKKLTPPVLPACTALDNTINFDPGFTSLEPVPIEDNNDNTLSYDDDSTNNRIITTSDDCFKDF